MALHVHTYVNCIIVRNTFVFSACIRVVLLWLVSTIHAYIHTYMLELKHIIVNYIQWI